MNHIYKVIWSRVKNSYVVVSEIAGTARKSGRVRVSKNTLAAVLAAFLLTGISVSPVSAALDGVNTFVEAGNQNIKIGNGTDLRNNSTKNGAIAIGDHAQIDDYVMQEGSIAIGKNAFVENMWGTQDKIFRFGMHSTDPSRTDHLLPAGIAIGQNTYARSGSLMIGDHKYVGALGDTTVNSNTDDEKRKLSVLVGATTVGLNSYSAGAFATTTGAYSIMTNAYDGNTNQGSAAQNFGAVINGSFNSIESKTSGSSVSGIANAVVGTANRTHNANGTLVFGAGNEVTNSVDNIANPMSFLGINSPKELAEKLREDIRRNDSGGAVLAIGGGNKADYAYRSQLVGVGNTLEGTAAEKAAYNLLNGYRNTGTNVSGVTVIGTNRTISNAKDTIVMGSSAGGITTTASKAVILGSEANAEKDGGVALGADSVASVDKDIAGYDPSTKLASTNTSAAWKATHAAVSVGNGSTATRQITGVAAGTNDTDAVNVAQLKKAVAGAADGNDTLVGGSNGLSLSGKTLSMSVKDTAGNEVKGSVDLSSVADGNDTLVRDNNALTLNGKELSMKIKDTAGNEVKGSVDLSAIAGQIDTNTTYTMSGTQNADNTTTITLKGSDGKENKVTVATKDTRNTVKAGENVTLDTAANTFGGTEYTVNVKADGKVENGNTKIVSGNTVYHETHVKNDGNYVKKENSAGDNLTILDKQVGKNTTNITNLGNTINNLNGKLGTLDNRISKVGAGAAALAALHPLDFDPHDKWDIAAGFGNYRNASAAAVGLFYRPNERTMMSLGWTMGDDRNMLNAGISVKLGRGDVYTRYSKVEMANQIKDLKEKNDKMQAENKEMRSELDELKAQVAALAAKK